MYDDDPDVLARMLQWLYTLEFPILASKGSNDTNNMWTADIDLWLLADKYGLTVLMEQCVDALLSTADRVASEYHHDRSSKAFAKSASDFVDMMTTLFTEAPPDREDIQELREEMLEVMGPIIASHMREVPVLEELIKEVPGFAIILVETLSKGRPSSNGSGRRKSSDSVSSGVRSSRSTGSRAGSTGSDSRAVKTHIPMNEDSEDEME